MSGVFVFLGPTLDRETAAQLLPAIYMPPATQGDVARLAETAPTAIAIIDGYFDRVPAVWHKEILWALHQGIPVFGSSSMGALRAAELADFGMCGVGDIFARYRDGSYEDDDEVAVLHATAEHGYRSLSDAMANIRPTLADAETQGVISSEMAVALCAIAKALHYQERSYSEVLRRAAGLGLPEDELARFGQWVPEGRVEQKRSDAIELLRVLGEQSRNGFRAPRTNYVFAHTDAWEKLRQSATPVELSEKTTYPVAIDALIDELVLEECFPPTREGSVRRALGLALANRHISPVKLEAEAIQAATVDFRRERSLLSEEAFTDWLDEQRLSTDESVSSFFTDEAKLLRILGSYAQDLGPHLVGHLRAVGSFGRLARRVEEKLTAFQGTLPQRVEESGRTESDLWHWFFEQRWGRAVPLDLNHYLSSRQGLGRERVLLAIIRDYCYSQTVSRVERHAGAECDKPLA